MIDLDSLLAPIAGDAPCGQDMVFSPQFDALQKAREQDDPSLEQGDWVVALKDANWPYVIEEGQALLRTSTKDLRLSVWLTEALAQTQGVAGLCDGFRLLAALCERWWDGLHPLPEDGDMEVRIGSVSWLALRCIGLLREAPVVDDGQLRYGAQAWDTAIAIDHARKRGAAHAEEAAYGKVTLEQFDKVRRGTPAAFFIGLHAELLACEQAVTRFEQVFDARTAAQGPSFAPIRSELASLRDTVERFAREGGTALGATPAEGASGPARPGRTPEPRAAAALANPTASPTSGQREGVHSRAQAIAQLKEVADYFERTEPSSPSAYMAKKAAMWADMPLHDWLRVVIKNEQELAQLEDLLGIRARLAAP